MLIRDEDWAKYRQHFTEKEKEELTAAVIGSVPTPAGLAVDETKKTKPILKKLRKLGARG